MYLTADPADEEIEDLERLPAIFCLLTENLACNLPHAIEYTNRKMFVDRRPTVEMEYFVSSKANYPAFAAWWNNKISGGRAWFHAMINFMGDKALYKVRFISDMTTSYRDGARVGHVKMELEAVMDNPKHIGSSVRILDCSTIIECNTLLEC